MSEVDKNQVMEDLNFILESRPQILTQWEKDLVNDRLEQFKKCGSGFRITTKQAESIKQIVLKVKLANKEKL